jgi:hypothetical protein
MSEVELQVSLPMPYFAELPYYLWGQINYDSEGDCKRPTDRTWSWLYMANRITGEQVEIKRDDGNCTITSESSAGACTKLKAFLMQRTLGVLPAEMPENWDHAWAIRRAEIVAQEFRRDELKPFDSHLFWGSWKWVGWFATDCTWVGRWIMHSVVRKDPRAVNLCIEWLKGGTVCAQQNVALRYALRVLTGRSFKWDFRWRRWYDKAGRNQYPEPDFKEWCAEMQAEFDPLLVLSDSET